MLLPVAYILIEATVPRVPNIVEELRKIPEVKSADITTGQFEIVVRVEAEDVNAVNRVNYTKIQMIDGILRTITLNFVKPD